MKINVGECDSCGLMFVFSDAEVRDAIDEAIEDGPLGHDEEIVMQECGAGTSTEFGVSACSGSVALLGQIEVTPVKA